MTRRYKTKRHNSRPLEVAGLWLVYDSEDRHHLPVTIKQTRENAALVARRFNLSGLDICANGQLRRDRDLRLARVYYRDMDKKGDLETWYHNAYQDAATRVTKEEAFRPRRALDIPI